MYTFLIVPKMKMTKKKRDIHAPFPPCVNNYMVYLLMTNQTNERAAFVSSSSYSLNFNPQVTVIPAQCVCRIICSVFLLNYLYETTVTVLFCLFYIFCFFCIHCQHTSSQKLQHLDAIIFILLLGFGLRHFICVWTADICINT